MHCYILSHITKTNKYPMYTHVFRYVHVECRQACTCVFLCICVHKHVRVYIYIYVDSDLYLDIGRTLSLSLTLSVCNMYVYIYTHTRTHTYWAMGGAPSVRWLDLGHVGGCIAPLGHSVQGWGLGSDSIFVVFLVWFRNS